jgi:hypothetical protein
VTDDTVAGYRLVRRLGEGPRAEVYLGYPARQGAEPRAVALKLYREGVPDASIMGEVEALSRAAGPHVLPLVDLASGTLIVERLAGGSFGRLLRDRPTLHPGEAITALAPLAGALEAMHAAGVVHGGIRLEALAFDHRGAPVFTCFGRSRLIEPNLPPALREAEHGIAEDCRAFLSVARAVLERVAGAEASALRVWLESGFEAAAGWLPALESRLYSLGEPQPVDLRAVDLLAIDQRPVDLRPVDLRGDLRAGERAPSAIGGPAFGSPGPADDPARSEVFSAVGVPEWLETALLEVRTRWAQVRGSLSAVRTRVWVTAAAALVAVVAGFTFIPGPATDATAQPEPPSTPTAAPAAAPSPRAGDDSSLDADPVMRDDPLAAVPALLAARERCIRDLSVLCLDAVGQQGSAALDDDQQLIRDLQSGGELPASWSVIAGELLLEERLGDSAMVSLGDVSDSEPASILLMKGEAGWRIRDYLER